MLLAEYHFAEGPVRATIVSGSGHDVALLGQAWLESGPVGHHLAIHTLYLLGYVDAGLYRFLKSVFEDPQIVERYSLTEIFGGASRREPKAKFLLDPYVMGEIVDEGGVPVSPGEAGELTLTELFPFVQMQPLIRYRTGDIVLSRNEEAELAFDWWGRRESCVRVSVAGVERWVAGYGPLADWLSLQPLVAREPHRAGLSSIASTEFGAPCVRLRNGRNGTHAMVDVGLRVNPWWALESVNSLAAGIWARLRKMVPTPLHDTIIVQIALRYSSKLSGDWLPDAEPGVRLEPARLADEVPRVSGRAWDATASQGRSCESASDASVNVDDER